ncbi:hypothetical protein [Teichococcus aestuarii]|uniref:hypothetical protein n=1 Tax=Teichococcus aestuarii TaxID=568898 RepID=UPI00360F2D41
MSATLAPAGLRPDPAARPVTGATPSATPGAMPLGLAIAHALGWQAAGLALLAAHVLLVRELGPLASAVALGGLLLLYAWLPLAGLVVYWQLALYQNAMVAFFCDGMQPGSFQVLLGTGFMATGLLGALAAARLLLSRRGAAAPARRIVLLACAAIALSTAYAAYGALLSSPASAAVYLRAATGMLLMLLVGLDAGRVWGFRSLAIGYLVSLAAGLGYSALEVADPAWFYEMTGGIPFMNLKYTAAELDWPFHTARDLIATRTSVLFNVTGSEATALSFRFGGPNIHPISYAYVIAMGGIAALALRWYGSVVLAAAVLAAMGVKGAMLTLVMTLGLWLFWHWAGRARLLLAVMAVSVVTYSAAVIHVGLQSGDFHVIGLIGGVDGFLRNPLGHGIGVGGNLSDTARAGVDMIDLQNNGADFALESAIGVLLYQLGLGLLLHLAAFAALLAAARPRRGWRHARPQATDAIFIGVAMTIVNGLFQEEAYTVYALGVAMLFAGALVANQPPGGRPARA